jgi:hypothetical protein
VNRQKPQNSGIMVSAASRSSTRSLTWPRRMTPMALLHYVSASHGSSPARRASRAGNCPMPQ